VCCFCLNSTKTNNLRSKGNNKKKQRHKPNPFPFYQFTAISEFPGIEPSFAFIGYLDESDGQSQSVQMHAFLSPQHIMAGFATPPRKSLESPEVIATGEAITEDVVGGMDFAL